MFVQFKGQVCQSRRDAHGSSCTHMGDDGTTRGSTACRIHCTTDMYSSVASFPVLCPVFVACSMCSFVQLKAECEPGNEANLRDHNFFLLVQTEKSEFRISIHSLDISEPKPPSVIYSRANRNITSATSPVTLVAA